MMMKSFKFIKGRSIMADRKRFLLSHVINVPLQEARLPTPREQSFNASLSLQPTVECGQIDGHPAAFYTRAGLSVGVVETPKGTEIKAEESHSTADGPATK